VCVCVCVCHYSVLKDVANDQQLQANTGNIDLGWDRFVHVTENS